MNIFVAGVSPKVRLISLFVVIGDRFVLCSWMPGKYPTKRCRIEKIIKDKALAKPEFLALFEAIPIALVEQFKGKSLAEWMSLVGTSFCVDHSDTQVG